MIADDKSVYAELFDEDTTPEFGQLVFVISPVNPQIAPVIPTDHSANRDAPELVHQREHSIKRFSSHIFKIDVDAIFTYLFQRSVHIAAGFEGHMI